MSLRTLWLPRWNEAPSWEQSPVRSWGDWHSLWEGAVSPGTCGARAEHCHPTELLSAVSDAVPGTGTKEVDV